MLHAHNLKLYELGDLRGDTASPEITGLRQTAAWASGFLNQPDPLLGRPGPVCPYTRPSMDHDQFLMAWLGAEHDPVSIGTVVDRYRCWFMEMLGQSEEPSRHLLTILLALPGFDRVDSDPLDKLQQRLKNAFVIDGLMIGQFHPHCEQSGLWNKDFRPLRAPIPLLVIRQMVASDLPFLLDSASHLLAYLGRFAPGIPGHVRHILAARIMKSADRTTVTA